MPKTTEAQLEYLTGKVNALAEVIMVLARQSTTPEQFRATVLPALERMETHCLNSNATDQHLLGIQVLRGWLDEQSQPAPAPRTQEN